MKDFKTPERIYRGTDFFMLNDRLSEDELRRQISEMADKGVASFIARTYIGLKSDYPGPDFMSKMSVMIDEAKKHDMTVFVQAGYMPEAVLDLPEEYALDYLCVYDEGENPEDETVLCRHGGKVYTRRSSKTCLNLFDKDSVEFYIHQSYDLWQPFSAKFGKTVSSIWVDEPSYHMMYLPWYASFDKVFLEKYGYDIKEHVYKLYCNEDDYKKVRYQYWTLLQKQLEVCYFAMISKWCRKNGLLFSGHLMMEDTLFLQIKRACAVMPYYKYFDIPGIDILMGYMNWKNDPIIDNGSTEFYTNSMYTTPMQAVSAAHQAGKEHILCEMYGVTTNGMGFRDFEYYFDHYASMGINHRSVHGIFYSLHGRAKRMYPPQVNYYQPYWEKYNEVTDYCARTSAFLSQGKPYAKTLVIHPMETAYCLFEGTKETDGECSAPLKKLDYLYNSIVRTLHTNHISYELGDINTIASGYGKISGGKFSVGQMEYETVVLPYIEVLNTGTAKLICEYIKCGGKVIVVGKYPTMLDGEECADIKEKYLDGAEFVEDVAQLAEMLASDGDLYRIKSDRNSGNIRVYHTRSENELYYMLFNDDCRDARGTVLYVPGNYDAILFNAENGQCSPLKTSFDGKETAVKITVQEGGSTLICFKSSNDSERNGAPEKIYSNVLPLSNEYSISRKCENVLLLEYCKYKTENMQDFEGPYTALTVNRILTDSGYCGGLIQRFEFRAEKPFCGLSLALEDAADCEVYLNGEKALPYDGKSYYYAKAFCRIKLPDSARKGINTLEVRRKFVPLSKAKSAITSLFECQLGVELESMYLLGDFGVYSVTEPTLNGLLRYSRNFVLGEEKKTVCGELTASGLMFYAGTVELAQCVAYKKSAHKARYYLELTDFHGCVAEVTINGKSCGNVYRAPYRADITDALESGNNDIRIYLTNTLRPILGPYHRTRGEVGECWGGGYGDPDSAWTGSSAGEDWYKHTDMDNSIWTDSYNQVRFGVLDARIIAETKA